MSARAAGGRLRQVIQGAARGAALSLRDLTVLEICRDPYRLDTPAGHRDGAWFAEQIRRFLRPGQTIHLRGLFYLVVAAGNVRKPDGTLVINTDKIFEWLTDEAAKAARWLGYVPFDRIVDERNAPPEFFLPEASPLSGWSLDAGEDAYLPDLEDALPSVQILGFDPPQPYRLIFVGEKTSLGTELREVAEDVGGELLLPAGELSDTLVAGIAERAAADGRPAAVFYFSDFDPAGRQMPISLARKLQALRDLKYPDLQTEVHAVALTLEQVRDLDLPSTPLKEGEARADAWRAAMGHEQTEIDALLALHPGTVASLARKAVRPFWDETLQQRANAVRQGLVSAAQDRLRGHPDYAATVLEIEAALENATVAVDAFHQAQAAARDILEEIELPDLKAPEAELGGNPPLPLFTTDDDFVTASQRLISHKALDVRCSP